MRNFASRVSVIGSSKIEESLKFIEQKPKIISLGAGEPDFKAPKNVIEAANKFLKKGYTHYAPLQGKLELREILSKKLKKENKIDAGPDEIIVTNGSKEAILLTTMTFVDPGDEVIIPDPGYLAYRPIVQMLGGVAVSLPLREENNFEIDIDELRSLVTNKTKMIIFNTPSNPTGTVFDRQTLEDIANLLFERNIYAMVDEAYEKLVYDDVKHVSLASLSGMSDYVVTVQSFSKTYAMCGFRLGYAVANREIIKEMKEFKLTTTLCAPTAYQLAGVEAIKHSGKYVEKMRKEYQRRRDTLCKRLSELSDVHCIKPKGAFYVFPNIKALGMSSEEFSDFIMKNAKVVVIPGTEFGVFGEGFVRMSYATEYKKIETAMDRIEKALKR